MLIKTHIRKLNDRDLMVIDHLLERELCEYPFEYITRNHLIAQYREILVRAKIHLNREVELKKKLTI